jgi:hypothetical protein
LHGNIIKRGQVWSSIYISAGGVTSDLRESQGVLIKKVVMVSDEVCTLENEAAGHPAAGAQEGNMGSVEHVSMHIREL